MNPEVVSEMIALRFGSGARLRVKRLGSDGWVTVVAPDVLVQVVLVVVPAVEFVQVCVMVLMLVPLTVVIVVTVVFPVVVVEVVVEFVAVADWKAVGERIGASTIEVGCMALPVARSTCWITPGAAAFGATVKYAP